MKYADKRTYIGHMDQLFRVKDYTLRGGRQEGVRAIDIDNGTGLELTILPDRCMDFYQVRFMGKNTNFIAPCGIVSPQKSNHFLDSFFAGFLTTCGTENIGAANEDQGKAVPMHGGLSATPAEHVSIDAETPDGTPTVVIRGQMRQAALFGPNMLMKRTIICRYGENKISFTDEVVNEGHREEPLMLLYHFNMGYPLLSENAVLHIPSEGVRAHNAHAERHIAQWRDISPPAFPYEEMCYHHHIGRLPDGTAEVGISNPDAEMELFIRYDRDLLDHFTQWKQLGKGAYAMGLEPCNASIRGRAAAREDGTLKFLQGGETKTYRFEIRFSAL